MALPMQWMWSVWLWSNKSGMCQNGSCFLHFSSFGSTVCGIAYGAFSTRMDPNKKGSFPGFEQVQKKMWKEEDAGKNSWGWGRIWSRPEHVLSFPFLFFFFFSIWLFSTPMELIANSVRFFFVFLSNKIRKCSVFVLIGTC